MYAIQARCHPIYTWLFSRLFKIRVQLLYHRWSFFQVNNSIIAVIIDIFKNCRYKHKKALPNWEG
nr:MAG TPA: hypothetical protein [Caudoviricetes sp.]